MWNNFFMWNDLVALCETREMIKDGDQRCLPSKWEFWVFQVSDVWFNLILQGFNLILHKIVINYCMKKILQKLNEKPTLNEFQKGSQLQFF